MEPSTKKRKLAPKISNPSSTSPTNPHAHEASHAHTAATSYSAESVSIFTRVLNCLLHLLVITGSYVFSISGPFRMPLQLRRPPRRWRPIPSAMSSSHSRGTYKMLLC